MRTQDKRSEIKFFDRLSRSSHLPGGVVFRRDADIVYDPRMWKKFFVEAMEGLSSTARVLDVGCGVGTFGLAFALKGYTVYGVDFSLGQIQEHRKLTNLKNVGITPVLADVENIPFMDESFDLCICGGVLHHFESLERVSAELFRVLRKGGKLSLFEPNGRNFWVHIRNNCGSPFRGCISVNERLLKPDELSESLARFSFEDFQVYPARFLEDTCSMLRRSRSLRTILVILFWKLITFVSDCLPDPCRGLFVIMHCRKPLG